MDSNRILNVSGGGEMMNTNYVSFAEEVMTPHLDQDLIHPSVLRNSIRGLE